MMKNAFRQGIAALTVTGALVGSFWPGAVLAGAIMDCSAVAPDVTGNTDNNGCEVLLDEKNDDNDTVSGMFGVYDWNRIARVEGFPGTDGALEVEGDTLDGTWTVAESVFDTYEQVMLIFKDGTVADPSNIVGYLISNPDIFSSEYTSPFYNGESLESGQKEISHITLYVSDTVDVPEPMTGFLIGGGLVGLFRLSRRRR